MELGARLVTDGTSLAKGALCKGGCECDGSFQNMLWEGYSGPASSFFRGRRWSPERLLLAQGDKPFLLFHENRTQIP